MVGGVVLLLLLLLLVLLVLVLDTSEHPLRHRSAVLSPDDHIPGGDRPAHSPATAQLTWKGNISISPQWSVGRGNQVSRGQ